MNTLSKFSLLTLVSSDTPRTTLSKERGRDSGCQTKGKEQQLEFISGGLGMLLTGFKTENKKAHTHAFDEQITFIHLPQVLLPPRPAYVTITEASSVPVEIVGK